MTSTTGRPRTWRELRDYLSERGAQHVRTKGSHEIWQFADGWAFVVIRNHLNASLPAWVLAKFRRLLVSRNHTETEDAALLGRGRNHAGFVLA
jgi:predicted RNA binding protein YcfA (HicA-like mRNA interferase family)